MFKCYLDEFSFFRGLVGNYFCVVSEVKLSKYFRKSCSSGLPQDFPLEEDGISFLGTFRKGI
jgi:hypothetical protein